MQDAVVLANCIYEMASANITNVEAALREFRLQRYEHVKIQYERSKINAKIIYGQVQDPFFFSFLAIQIKWP